MSRGLSKSNFWSYLNDYTLKQWLQKAMEQQMYHERFRTLLLKAYRAKCIIGAITLKIMHVYCMETLPFVPLFHLHLNFSLSRTLFPCRCHLRNKNWKIKLKNYFGSVSISMIIWWNRKRTNILWSVWPYIASMLFNL